MSDAREQDHQWYSRFDEKRMRIILNEDDENEMEIPAKFSICDTCDGKGKHVNPSIDSHGLSREDFDEDPDFAEDYMSGMYDVPCAECHGRRVVPVIDEDRATPEQKKACEEAYTSHYQHQAEMAYARRMGF